MAGRQLPPARRWVQRLVHGQDHKCIVDGVDAEKIWYGNYCDLIDIP